MQIRPVYKLVIDHTHRKGIPYRTFCTLLDRGHIIPVNVRPLDQYHSRHSPVASMRSIPFQMPHVGYQRRHHQTCLTIDGRNHTRIVDCSSHWPIPVRYRNSIPHSTRYPSSQAWKWRPHSDTTPTTGLMSYHRISVPYPLRPVVMRA